MCIMYKLKLRWCRPFLDRTLDTTTKANSIIHNSCSSIIKFRLRNKFTIPEMDILTTIILREAIINIVKSVDNK